MGPRHGFARRVCDRHNFSAAAAPGLAPTTKSTDAEPTTGLGTGSIQDNSPVFAERLAPRLPTKPNKTAPSLPRKTPSVHNEK